MKKGSNVKLVVVVCAIIAVLLGQEFVPLSSVPSAPTAVVTETDADTTIHFIDVGQGDAALIVSGESAVLIDGGKQSSGDTVVDYLTRQGIATLDAVIATHPHEDHIGGLVDVLETFEVEAFYMSDQATDTRIFENLLDAIVDEGISPEFPEIGDTIPVGDSDAVLTVLAPGADSSETYGDDPNVWSLVMRLDAGGCSALFTGDTTTEVEQDILADNLTLLDCDILKVAHHGSRTSSCEEFLEAVSPSYAIISYGAGNSYGLPDEEIFEYLEPMGTQILETAQLGSIVLTMTNGEVNVQ